MLKYTSVLILLFGCALANAEVYRWVDDQGTVHYGERPPVGVESSRLRLPTEPASTGAPLKDRRVVDRERLLNSFEQDRLARKQAIEEQREQERQREQLCEDFKARWRLYTSVGRLYDVAEDGSRHYLSDAEKEAELARLRAGMQQSCDQLPAAVTRSERR